MTGPYRGCTPSISIDSAPSWGATTRRQLLVGASVLALVAASDVVIPPRPAWAVICQNSGAGGNSGNDGAVGLNTACGLNADATGGAANTAIGNAANAKGTNSSNTASGSGADASGNSSSNSAYGNDADATGVNSANIRHRSTGERERRGRQTSRSALNANASGTASNNLPGQQRQREREYRQQYRDGRFANASGATSRNSAYWQQRQCHR